MKFCICENFNDIYLFKELLTFFYVILAGYLVYVTFYKTFFAITYSFRN